jgi:hypothetical protein
MRQSKLEFTPPIGPNWVAQFISRHPHLRTKMSNAIEVAHIKEVTRQQVRHFNAEFYRIIRQYNIRLENIYNADEISSLLIMLTDCRMFNWNTTGYKYCR